MVWPASKETGSGHTLVVLHSPVQLTTVSWEDICYKWCASEDHFRPLIIFILHKWLAQLSASLSSEMYTNDTSITYAGTDVNNNINERLNYDLNKIYVWLAANNNFIVLNIKKLSFSLLVQHRDYLMYRTNQVLLSMTLRLNKSWFLNP